jgi:hypothetical protein
VWVMGCQRECEWCWRGGIGIRIIQDRAYCRKCGQLGMCNAAGIAAKSGA